MFLQIENLFKISKNIIPTSWNQFFATSKNPQNHQRNLQEKRENKYLPYKRNLKNIENKIFLYHLNYSIKNSKKKKFLLIMGKEILLSLLMFICSK